MSAGSHAAPPPRDTWTFSRLRDAVAVPQAGGWGLRLATFTALAGYGVVRWATLLRPAPGWRLAGLLALAVGLAAVGPLLSARSRLFALLAALLALLVSFPIAGLRWQWFIHERIAVSADRIGTGLQALPGSSVPYTGSSHAIRLVIVLGAAVLLLDAAAVVGIGAGRIGDGRRAAAALPLLALAIVPSTLIRPEFAYLQGLVVFALLATFLWADRVSRDAAATAAVLIATAGLAGALLAARVDPRSPWIDYRSWSAAAVPVRVDTFNWNQTYGPLHWPRAGHEVLSIQARIPDYWKAADLDTFDGYGWVQSSSPEPVLASSQEPHPSSAEAASWIQRLRVTIVGMQTESVIAAGYAAAPTGLPGQFTPGQDAGTWVSARPLGPGTSYQVLTYSPRPTAAQLATAGAVYPAALAPDLTLGMPLTGAASAATAVSFPPFRARGVPSVAGPGQRGSVALDARALERSPYAGAYALARRLAARAPTPAAFVAAVQSYLAQGFTYNEDPPVGRYPLESFLFSSRQGYCQQFSGAMALLLRMGGVPARVASGFTSGAYDPVTHSWQATDFDAHAWVEVWFPQYGWVRFDPTPGSAPARSGASAPPIIKNPGGQSTLGSHGLQSGAANSPAGTTPGASAGARSSDHWPLIAAAAAAAAALAWLVALILRAHDRGGDRLAELERALARTRRPVGGGVTLAGLEHHMRSAPDAAAYVRTLRLARYAGGRQDPTRSQRRALRRELALGLGLRGRLRAWWALPPRLPGRRGRA